MTDAYRNRASLIEALEDLRNKTNGQIPESAFVKLIYKFVDRFHNAYDSVQIVVNREDSEVSLLWETKDRKRAVYLNSSEDGHFMWCAIRMGLHIECVQGHWDAAKERVDPEFISKLDDYVGVVLLERPQDAA